MKTKQGVDVAESAMKWVVEDAAPRRARRTLKAWTKDRVLPSICWLRGTHGMQMHSADGGGFFTCRVCGDRYRRLRRT